MTMTLFDIVSRKIQENTGKELDETAEVAKSICEAIEEYVEARITARRPLSPRFGS